MKTYIVAFSEDYQLSISLFALLEDAQRYYCEQVCEIYEYEQCGNLVAEMEAGNMTKAYELAKDLFGERVDSTVDNMVLEEREVPTEHPAGSYVQVLTDRHGWRIARVTKVIVEQTAAKTTVEHEATIMGKIPNHMRKWHEPDTTGKNIRPRN
jgi:hypothetical protein